MLGKGSRCEKAFVGKQRQIFSFVLAMNHYHCSWLVGEWRHEHNCMNCMNIIFFAQLSLEHHALRLTAVFAGCGLHFNL
jgi:hypothetical protein